MDTGFDALQTTLSNDSKIIENDLFGSRIPTPPTTPKNGATDLKVALENSFTPLRNLFVRKTNSPNLIMKNTTKLMKYQREYEEMVKNYEENQRKKEEALEKTRKIREETVETCIRLWKESDLVANWESKKKLRATQKLVFKGIPPNIRTVVWPVMVGNRLAITEELYQIYVAQAKRLQKLAGSEVGREDSMNMIKLDLDRTFPALSFFQPQGPLHSQLLELLEAYVTYRPDIGYVQGMSFIASVLLLVLDTYTAYRCFVNILNRPLFIGFFRMDIDHINKFVDIVEKLMDVYLPTVLNHLKSLNITTHVFVMDWVLTLFTKTLPLDIAFRVWDCFFLEGEFFIFKVGLALIAFSAENLLSSSYENCMLLLTHFPSPSEEELFTIITNLNMNPKCDKLVELYLNEINPH